MAEIREVMLLILTHYEHSYLMHKISNNQGSHRSPKVLNVLEFDFSIRVPSNVLEFH